MARTQGLILFVALTAGCSATKEIASSASVAASAAHSISERASFIVANSSQPEIVAAAVVIKGDAAVILHEVAQISTAVAGVKDIVPFWGLVQWALGAVVAVALVVAVAQLILVTSLGVAAVSLVIPVRLLQVLFTTFMYLV